MRYVLEDIEARDIPEAIRRHGVPLHQRLRVVVETIEESLPLARLAEEGGAFGFLADEPDLYGDADIKQRNV